MSGNAFFLSPLERRSVLKQDGQIVWGGSMLRTSDGRCHLFVSVWPFAEKFTGWITHSTISHATADDPLGPYTFTDYVFAGSGLPGGWDRDVTHNPTVHCFDGKYYLYYTGNYGDGTFQGHRKNQRIGVAVADHPEGPWARFDKPLLDVTEGGWDCLMLSNPAVVRRTNGQYLLVYKAAGDRGPEPGFGPIYHGVAVADNPLGPFRKHPEPVFLAGDNPFPGEDPYVFERNGILYAILKDMGTNYSDSVRALVLFESIDGVNWHLTSDPLVSTRTLAWEDGSRQEFYRLERPQLYLENGVPSVLFCAVKPEEDEHEAYNIHFRIEQILPLAADEKEAELQTVRND